MFAWADGLLSAVAEAAVFGRLGYAIASGVDPALAPWCFPLAAASHIAGQAAAALSTRKSKSGEGSRAALLQYWLGPGVILGFTTVRSFGQLGFGGILVAMLTWALCSSRGITTVTQPTGSEGVRRGMVSGTVVLAFLSLVGWDGGTPVAGEILVFLILSSATLVLRRRHEVARKVSVQARAPWATGGVAFVAVTLIAVLILYAVGSGGFGTFVRVLAALRDFVAVAFGYIMTPFAYLVQWLILHLQKYLSGRETEGLEMQGRPGEGLLEQLEEYPELATMPDWLKWTGLALVVLGVVGVAWLLVSRFYKRTQSEESQETRASLVGGGALKEWLDGLGEGARDLADDLASRLRSLLGREPGTPEEVYAATIALLARRGMPREPHLTPYEYRDLVAGEMQSDGSRAALATVTCLFTDFHYSGRTTVPEEFQTMKEAYRSLVSEDAARSAKP